MTSISDKQKKRGRGRPRTGVRPMVGFRAGDEITSALDAAARAEPDEPSRSEMIRRIVSAYLRERGFME